MARYLQVYKVADCEAKGGLNNANEGNGDPKIRKGDINRKGAQSKCALRISDRNASLKTW